jgi:hypothetical protein
MAGKRLRPGQRGPVFFDGDRRVEVYAIGTEKVRQSALIPLSEVGPAAQNEGFGTRRRAAEGDCDRENTVKSKDCGIAIVKKLFGNFRLRC